MIRITSQTQAAPVLGATGTSSAALPTHAVMPSEPVWGAEQVKRQLHNHQIPDQHLDAFIKIAEEKNIVFGIRPSTRGSARYKLAGNATKPLEVKAKTCHFGIAMGLICKDQQHSKNHGDRNAIARANSEVQALLDDGNSGVVARPLMLSAEDLRFLHSEGEISFDETKLGKGGPLLVKARGAEDAAGTLSMQYEASPKEGGYEITHLSGFARTKLEVLATDPADNSPGARMRAQITADYDLLVVATPFENFGGGSIARPSAIDPFHDVQMDLSRTTAPVAAEASRQPSDFPRSGWTFANTAPAVEFVNPFSGGPAFGEAERRPSVDMTASRRSSQNTVASFRGRYPYTPPRKHSAGVVSVDELALIGALNLAASAGGSQTLFHHGGDHNNLDHYNPKANEGSVLFFPSEVRSGSGVMMAPSQAAIESVLREIKDAPSKFMSITPAWGAQRSSETFERRASVFGGSVRRPSLLPADMPNPTLDGAG